MVSYSYLKLCAAFATLTALLVSGQTFAQGQDGTPAERDILILDQLLTGYYDNANQAYFDVRLRYPDKFRHKKMAVSIAKVDKPDLGSMVYLVKQFGSYTNQPAHQWFYTFAVDNNARAVRMQTHVIDDEAGNVKYLKDCDLLWRQEVGQFSTTLDNQACNLNQGGEPERYKIMLSEHALGLNALNENKEPYNLMRTRNFTCYINAPAVGGGRDIDYKHFDLEPIHDAGAEAWVRTNDGQEVGIRLFRVIWTFNTLIDVFNRPGIVIYGLTRNEDGTVREEGYSWAAAESERIGINLGYMMANCAMLPGHKIKPFYKYDEPKVR